jgi:hypothetical protein
VSYNSTPGVSMVATTLLLCEDGSDTNGIQKLVITYSVIDTTL